MAQPPLEPELHERLSAYIDGEMDAVDAIRFEEEMQRDPRLRAAWGELVALRDYMLRAAQEAAPRTFYQRTVDALDADKVARRREAPSMTVPFGLILLAAAVLFFLYGLPAPEPVTRASVAAPPEVAATDPTAPATPTEAAAGLNGAPPVVDRIAAAGGATPPDLRSGSTHPYPLAPDAYRVWGEGSFAQLQLAVAEIGGKLTDRQGAPLAAPLPSGEVWVEIPAERIGPLRKALDARLRVEAIGMPSMISGTHRQRVLVPQP
jgi:negative regulator of sigma E activity